MSNNEKSFEEAMKELEEIVEKLEQGDLTLDKSLELFQQGVEYARFCSGILDRVERKINVLIEKDNGTVQEKPFFVEPVEEE